MSSERKNADPTEALPAWARPQHGEDERAWGKRIAVGALAVAFRRAMAGETAAHAKFLEAWMKGVGLGQRTELDINAHNDDAWLAALTDDELAKLASLRESALQRVVQGQTKKALQTFDSNGDAMHESDNSFYVKSSEASDQSDPTTEHHDE